MSGYLGARTQIADTGAYNREQADDLFPSKESVVAFSSTGTNTTMVKPPVYGIRVLEFTGATGTITLPDMSGEPGGGRFRIMKRNTTQGSVVIEPGFGEQDGMLVPNPGVWGNVELKLNADGDFWELQWTGSRFVLTDGHETGEDGYGEYEKGASGALICFSMTLSFSSFSQITSNSDIHRSVRSNIGFPQTFISIPSYSVSVKSFTGPAPYVGWTVSDPTDEDAHFVSVDGIFQANVCLIPANSGVPDTVVIEAHATGNWYE